MATSDSDERAAVPSRRPELIVVCGLPGVGKSTVADWVTAQVDGVHLRTDEIRKELFEDPEYTEAETRTVYQTLLERGRAAVARGTSAVLDATFKRREHRRAVPEIATAEGVSWRLIKVDAAENVVRKRIEDRTDDLSDADVSIHEKFRREYDPIRLDHEVVDNSDSFAATERELERRFPWGETPLVQ